MFKALIVDDDHALFALLCEYLHNAGFACTHAPDTGAGLDMLAREAWDIVILDIMLPGGDGYDVLRHIRSREEIRSLPVIMLTARGEENDKVAGLEMGADDYLAKPFGARELVARLRALLRRSDAGLPASAATLQFGDLAIDRNSMSLSQGGERVQLTAGELRAIELFAASPGCVIERDTLYREVLGHEPFPQDRSLDMMMSRLRKKLGPRGDGGERIRAARGRGYVFLVQGDA